MMAETGKAEIILYIAVSLDGYIARPDGSVDWLEELDNSGNPDYGYTDFIKRIDTVVLGRKTYDIALGFDMPWPYKDVTTYVVTTNRELEIPTPLTEKIFEISAESIKWLRDKSKKNIWLMGGGELVTAFQRLGAIDEYIISVIPRILGDGIPLFAGIPDDLKLDLLSSQEFSNGVVILTYRPA